jgi:hypothetical protein
MKLCTAKNRIPDFERPKLVVIPTQINYNRNK